jgi:hypothetical protein
MASARLCASRGNKKSSRQQCLELFYKLSEIIWRNIPDLVTQSTRIDESDLRENRTALTSLQKGKVEIIL